MKFAEIAVKAKHPFTGANVTVFMYFEMNAEYTPQMVADFLDQNKQHLVPEYTSWEESQQFESREAADAHVKDKSIDNYNGIDMYWWPPLVVAPSSSLN